MSFVLLLRRLLASALLCLPLAAAAFDHIQILVANPSPATDEFIRSLRSQLDARNAGQVSIRARLDSNPPPEGTLTIAVGVQALQQAASQRGAVLGVLIPQPAFERLHTAGNAASLSAIFLDQPPARQMQLLRQLLPQADSIGIPLGPVSAPLQQSLVRAAKEHGLKAVTATIDKESELTPALRGLLEGADALLAVPDPVVHQPTTAQTLLLTSYRYQKPVIGYSQAYVNAGALAAAFSSPADIARQAAEILNQIPERSTTLPPPQAPRFFSIAINRQVARSLGIEPQDPATLAEHLMNEAP